MVTDINAADWEEIIKAPEKPAVVDFWHEQCIWCQRLNPVYDELAAEYDQADFAKLNVRSSEANMKIAQEHGIMGTPTIKVFCQGQEVGEIVGFRDKQALRRELDEILNTSQECVSQSSKIA